MNSDLEKLKWTIYDEGLEYAIMRASSWVHIRDDTFHQYRQNFIEAFNELENYIDGME